MYNGIVCEITDPKLVDHSRLTFHPCNTQKEQIFSLKYFPFYDVYLEYHNYLLL